jgi:hypothetical protein
MPGMADEVLGCSSVPSRGRRRTGCGETCGEVLEPEGVSSTIGPRKRVGTRDSSIGTPSAVIGRSVKQALLVTGGNVGLTEPGDPGTTR